MSRAGTSVDLYAPISYWEAGPADRAGICNGCGTKGLGGWLVPDTLYGLSITEACNIHDWMYAQGDTIADKEQADRAFLNNMLRIIESKSIRILLWPRRMRAMKYYSAVRDFGGPAFWQGKNAPGELGMITA